MTGFRRRTRTPLRRPPTTLLAMLPGVGWVNLATHLRSRLLDIDWDHKLPGGPAKVNAKLLGEHRLVPGTLLAVFDGACPVWSGEIESTDPDPQSKLTSLVGRGRVDTMQDGLVYDKTYVKVITGEVRDARTILGVSALYGLGATVEIGQQQLQIGHGQGVPAFANEFMGWFYDLGPANTAKAASFNFQHSNNWGAGPGVWFYNDAANGDGTVRDENLPGAAGLPMTGGSAGSGWYVNINGVFTTARRFVGAFAYLPGAATPAADVWARMTNIVVFSDSAYMSAGASVLKVDAVAKDIVANAGIPSISSTQKFIAAGTTNITELASNADNPKSLLERANAVDNMQWYFGNDPIPAMVLRAEPTDLRWAPLPGEVSLEGGTQASSIVDVYNQVRVRWTDANGGAENVTTVTLSPDTTVLARVGRTRTADVKVTRFVTTTEAAAIGAAFLREHRQAPLKASIKTIVPWIRTASGMRMPVSMLTVGDRIRIPIRDSVSGAIGREGVIYGVSVNPRTGVATISLDSDTSLFDRQLAHFESRAA